MSFSFLEVKYLYCNGININNIFYQNIHILLLAEVWYMSNLADPGINLQNHISMLLRRINKNIYLAIM